MGKSATSARVIETLNQGFNLTADVAPKASSAGLVLRVRDLLMREIDDTLAGMNISHARQQVLAVICRSPEGLQMGEIAARAALHPATLTGTIDRLVRDGLIKRRAVTKDRRATRIVATQKGVTLYEEARDALIGIGFGLADISIETINSLNVALDKVAEVLECRAAEQAMK